MWPRGLRVVSGVQPSGAIHLGNYFGAIKQQIELQKENTCYYFIANYHAMTTVRSADLLRKATREIAIAYLALGLDTEKVALYRQSDLPETCELHWILSTVTTVSLLERAHAMKEKVSKGFRPSAALFTYPVLMAADIFIIDGEIVPAGQDQIQHVEIAQDIAERFNHRYGIQHFKPPQILLSPSPKVPGIDGQKMSKSYGNTIDLFAPMDEVARKIRSIKTDSASVHEAKDPDRSSLYALVRLLASAEESEYWRERFLRGPLSYGEVKERLVVLFEIYFESARKHREALWKTPEYIESIFCKGAEKTAPFARAILSRTRRICGLD